MINSLIQLAWKLSARSKKLSNWMSAFYSSFFYCLTLPPYFSLLKKIKPWLKQNEVGFGINVAGYLTMESGVGEAARSLVRIIESTGFPFALNNIEDPLTRSKNSTYSHLFKHDNPFGINVLCFNADQIPSISRRLTADWFSNKYTIGYWVWELETFPRAWDPSFRCLNEIWTPSTFCTDAIRTRSPLPVQTIPYAIDITSINTNRSRESFGLHPDSFVFLFIFSLQSAFERKNPLAVISAFRKAFQGLGKNKVSLVLKFSGAASHRWAFNEIMKACGDLPIVILNSYLDNATLYRLMQLSDCYVSLHRSEGFGLTIAESMFLGKPCIATAYSGNMEFMTEDTSYPVRCVMEKVKMNVGPYRKGSSWATPDQDHAAELMRYVYDHPDQSRKIGERAAQHIRNAFSPSALARAVQQRMKDIQ